MRRRFPVVAVLVGLLTAGCSGGEVAVTVAATLDRPPVEQHEVQLQVVIVPAPDECGAEAAIMLAQTQSDLALAAVAEVSRAEAETSDPAQVALTGQAAFSQAAQLMAGYEVPACLDDAKTEAVRVFAERTAGYRALATGDRAQYEERLQRGEAARQVMVEAISDVLAQQ